MRNPLITKKTSTPNCPSKATALVVRVPKPLPISKKQWAEITTAIEKALSPSREGIPRFARSGSNFDLLATIRLWKLAWPSACSVGCSNVTGWMGGRGLLDTRYGL